MKTHALALTLLLGLAACASPPETRFYTLSDAEPVSTEAPVSPQTPLMMSRVQMPEYLDDRRLWVRTESHRLQALPNVRWAESLPRATTGYLQQRLGAVTERVHDGGGHRLLVDLDHFEARWGESGEEDRMILSGRWRLEGQSGPAHPFREERVLEDRQAATLVAAKSRLLERLAEEIASTVSQQRRQQAH
ncbi:MAG: PqiC family protein [Oleiphilaceae bacterium]|nr:PqiC family protein [Oleiphilaceae bacterium]